MQKRGDRYYVEVYNVYDVHEFGCGVDNTYEKEVKVGAYTVDGTSYHVYDSQSEMACGYKAAQNCNGVVTCGGCDQQQQG